MQTKKAFYFSYPNGIGEVHETSKEMTVDFEKHEGHGICFREGVDFSYNGEKELYLELKGTPLVLKLEFKTLASGGSPDTSVTLDNGNEYVVTIPKLLSPIKEIVIAALSYDNLGKKDGTYSVPTFELI